MGAVPTTAPLLDTPATLPFHSAEVGAVPSLVGAGISADFKSTSAEFDINTSVQEPPLNVIAIEPLPSCGNRPANHIQKNLSPLVELPRLLPALYWLAAPPFPQVMLVLLL